MLKVEVANVAPLQKEEPFFVFEKKKTGAGHALMRDTVA